MCGIVGICNLSEKPVELALLKKMSDTIAHRGPDGEGHFVFENMGLGHRRLAIIDLSTAGQQPMHTRDGAYSISYNGEVYNYRELKTELRAAGHGFHSETDSEVVLNAMVEWGIQGLEKLNGMFAFAYFDRNNRELILARDRYGIKPLYYYEDENYFIFGSEIKAILAHPGVRAGLNYEGLLEYFTFQNFFTDGTLFNKVKLLPPGCYLKFNTKTHVKQIVRYWDYHFVETTEPLKEKVYLEQLHHLFEQAVNRQLVSDVPIGSYLSGGMDSGSITMLASKKVPNLQSFTIGFDLQSASGIEVAYDERQKAEHISYLAKTEHYEMVLKAGDMERCMQALVWHLEEPRVGQSYPNYYAAKLAGKFGKVVLGGTGGDELFGGYPWRYYRAIVNNDFEHYIDKYYSYWQRLLSHTEIKEMFAPILHKISHVNTRDIFRDVFASHADKLTTPEDYVNHSLYFEAKNFLHGLLVVEDKLSMAHSLETRVPFLDNDLVDFAMKLPLKYKLGNLQKVIKLDENEPGKKTQKYYNKTKDGKLILRKIMERYIPKSIAEGAKQGFSAPDANWFKGESIDFIRDTLFNNNAKIYNFLEPSVVKRVVDDHLEGGQNRRLLIWSLLYMEIFCKTFDTHLS